MDLCDIIYWLDRLQPDSPTISSTAPTIKVPTIDSLIRRREKQDNQKRAWLNKTTIDECTVTTIVKPKELLVIDCHID